ncbi:hypothetical protein ACFRFU_19470 [Streptomyces sp. NPDC056704]|uniref:hypothetical protein n=1 Tax=Streptomyces sp. NPDC056704 TaxID=3345917 RepID=UPI0036B4451F
MSGATPGDELRAAAETLRGLAKGAPANSSAWRYAKGLPSDSVRTASGWEVAYGDTPGDLRYIAAMHPEIGLAVADLLEAVSYDPDDGALDDPGSDRHDACDRTVCAPAAALAVARALVRPAP